MKNIFENNKTCLKWATRILIALFIVFSLNCKLEILDPVYPFNTILGCVCMQFAYAFNSSLFADILQLIAVILLIKYVEDKGYKWDFSLLSLSLIFSVLYILSVSFRDYDDMSLITASPFQKIQTILFILGFALFLYYSMVFIFDLMDKAVNAAKMEKYSDNVCKEANRIWLVSGIVIFVCWLPWIIMDYPGSFSVDSLDQLQQFLGHKEWSSHHPPFSTLLLGLCFYIGKIVNSVSFGIFVFALIQTLAGACIYSYGIKKGHEWRIPKKILICVTCFFAFLPMWGLYAQYIEKSLLYNELVVLLGIMIIDFIHKQNISKRQMNVFTIAGILTCLLRNNGIYVIIPATIAVIWLIAKADRKKLIISTTVIIAVYMVIVKAIYPMAGIKSGSKAEIFSVPFLQTARCVYSCEDQITEEEKQAISDVLWYEKISERYESQKDISDAVKSLYSDNDSKLPAYFKTWFKMMFKYPNLYLSAFINNNYGYLAPVEGGIDVCMDYGQEEWMKELGIKHAFDEMPIKIFDGVYKGSNGTWPVFSTLSSSGLYIWMLIILMVYAVKRRKLVYIFAMTPSIMTTLICFASPSPSILRYSLSITALTPFYLMSLIKNTEYQDK